MINYCGKCGAKAEPQIPVGDDRERAVCTDCGFIHYENPRVIVGCLPVAGDKVLLCKRAIEPQKGLWTLPAGFMENGETMVDGACRETREEACADVADAKLYRLFDLPYINQVYIFYRANLVGDYGVGPESLEVALYSEDEIPWDQIAFPVITDTLTEFFEDRKSGEFPTRVSKPTRLWAEQGNKRVN